MSDTNNDNCDNNREKQECCEDPFIAIYRERCGSYRLYYKDIFKTDESEKNIYEGSPEFIQNITNDETTINKLKYFISERCKEINDIKKRKRRSTSKR